MYNCCPDFKKYPYVTLYDFLFFFYSDIKNYNILCSDQRFRNVLPKQKFYI